LVSFCFTLESMMIIRRNSHLKQWYDGALPAYIHIYKSRRKPSVYKVMLLHAKAAQLPFSILKWRSISRQPSAPQLLFAPSPTEKFHCSWRAISVILLLISSKIILKKLTHSIKKKKTLTNPPGGKKAWTIQDRCIYWRRITYYWAIVFKIWSCRR